MSMYVYICLSRGAANNDGDTDLPLSARFVGFCQLDAAEVDPRAPDRDRDCDRARDAILQSKFVLCFVWKAVSVSIPRGKIECEPLPLRGEKRPLANTQMSRLQASSS